MNFRGIPPTSKLTSGMDCPQQVLREKSPIIMLDDESTQEMRNQGGKYAILTRILLSSTFI
jgi:hypothetical protein